LQAVPSDEGDQQRDDRQKANDEGAQAQYSAGT
jgi:hypothetical protein